MSQLHLSELASVWWSLRPLNSYFGIGIELGLMRPRGVPDCLVTDRPCGGTRARERMAESA